MNEIPPTGRSQSSGKSQQPQYNSQRENLQNQASRLIENRRKLAAEFNAVKEQVNKGRVERESLRENCPPEKLSEIRRLIDDFDRINADEIDNLENAMHRQDVLLKRLTAQVSSAREASSESPKNTDRLA